MIRIGVSSQDKTAREASDANAQTDDGGARCHQRRMTLPTRDIQTSRLSLQPQYDPNKSGTARLTASRPPIRSPSEFVTSANLADGSRQRDCRRRQ